LITVIPEASSSNRYFQESGVWLHLPQALTGECEAHLDILAGIGNRLENLFVNPACRKLAKVLAKGIFPPIVISAAIPIIFASAIPI
jgi:hypothetical protein